MRVDLIQLEFIDRKMREMILDLEKTFCVEFTGTSIYRMDDDGVHGELPVRGTDLQCTYEPLAMVVMEYINSNWTYDPSRPSMECCIWHDAGSGFHLHLQVHPSTIRGD